VYLLEFAQASDRDIGEPSKDGRRRVEVLVDIEANLQHAYPQAIDGGLLLGRVGDQDRRDGQRRDLGKVLCESLQRWRLLGRVAARPLELDELVEVLAELEHQIAHDGAQLVRQHLGRELRQQREELRKALVESDRCIERHACRRGDGLGDRRACRLFGSWLADERREAGNVLETQRRLIDELGDALGAVVVKVRLHELQHLLLLLCSKLAAEVAHELIEKRCQSVAPKHKQSGE